MRVGQNKWGEFSVGQGPGLASRDVDGGIDKIELDYEIHTIGELIVYA